MRLISESPLLHRERPLLEMEITKLSYSSSAFSSSQPVTIWRARKSEWVDGGQQTRVKQQYKLRTGHRRLFSMHRVAVCLLQICFFLLIIIRCRRNKPPSQQSALIYGQCPMCWNVISSHPQNHTADNSIWVTYNKTHYLSSSPLCAFLLLLSFEDLHYAAVSVALETSPRVVVGGRKTHRRRLMITSSAKVLTLSLPTPRSNNVEWL